MEYNKIGIISGEGMLPIEISKSLTEKNIEFAIASFRKSNDLFESDAILEANFGKIKEIINFFQSKNITKIIFAGSVKRPNLSELKVDSEGAKLIASIFKSKIMGDDNVLKNIINFLEKHEFEVVSSQDICPNLLTTKGILTKTKPSKKDMQDIEIASNLLELTSPFDVGQSVIIDSGVIIAIEAIEGTDEMIKRIKPFQKNNNSAILVKMSKKNQELRADLPTIGLTTLKNMKYSEIKGIALKASESLILEKEELIKFANREKIFIIGV